MNSKALAMMALAILTLTISVSAQSQTGEQHITVKLQPSQTVEERVAADIKEKQLKKAAEEKLEAEERIRVAALSPKELLARARTIYVDSDTNFFEAVQLQNELGKRDEFNKLQLAIIDGWSNVKNAELMISIDRPLFTYTFTYQIIHRDTGVILATGKLIAFDGNLAAPKLADRIIEDIKHARSAVRF